MKGYKKLLAWQQSNELAQRIYCSTRNFPNSEMFGITSQLRRAALSVPTNIVEGMGRQSKADTKRFLSIALGSLAETEYLLEFSYQLKYLDDVSFDNIEALRKRVGALLYKLYKSF